MRSNIVLSAPISIKQVGESRKIFGAFRAIFPNVGGLMQEVIACTVI